VPGQRVWGVIEGSFQSLSLEGVPHDFCSEALKARVFYFIKAMAVQDGNEGVMVSEDGKVWQACEKDVTLFDCPCDSQQLKFDDGIV